MVKGKGKGNLKTLSHARRGPDPAYTRVSIMKMEG